MMVSRALHEDPLRDRWLLSYADFMSLLLALFVVLYSVSSVNEGRYELLAESLSDAFQRPLGKTSDDLGVPEKRPDGPRIEELLAKLQTVREELGSEQLVSITTGEQWIDLVLDSSLLFNSASAAVEAANKPSLHKLANIISEQWREIRVQGHTDNVPITSETFPSNWELSAMRAASVVRLLAAGGVEPTLLSAVGYGDTEPVADNNTAAGRSRNRRVVIQVSRQVTVRPVEAAASPPGRPAVLAEGKRDDLSGDGDRENVPEPPAEGVARTSAHEDLLEALDPALLRQLYQMEFGEPQRAEFEWNSGPASAIGEGVEKIRTASGGLLIKGRTKQKGKLDD